MRFGSHARWGDFNGTTQYLQLPDANDLSVTSRGRLTIEARIRPDTLPFPSQEGSGYVYLLGKGARQTSTSKSPGCTPRPNRENRANRISGHAFNVLGSGSHLPARRQLSFPGWREPRLITPRRAPATRWPRHAACRP